MLESLRSYLQERFGKKPPSPEENMFRPHEEEINRKYEMVRINYNFFVLELDTKPDYANLRERPDLLEKVKNLHPKHDIPDRLIALKDIEAILKDDPDSRTLISSALVRLLDDIDPLYRRQITLEAVRRLKITEALPKLKSMFRDPDNWLIKTDIMGTFTIFSFDQIEDVINEGLEDPTSYRNWRGMVEATLFTMRSLDLPEDMLGRVWQMFGNNPDYYGKINHEGELLAIKDTERFSERLINIIDETFKTVGPRELVYVGPYAGPFDKYEPQDGIELSKSELSVKIEALKNRYAMLEATKLCIDHLVNPELLVKKLNEWFALNLGPVEESHILRALRDKANLETIHLIAGKRLYGSNLFDAFILISRNFNRFSDDPVLQEYLDRYAKNEKYQGAISAIRANKRLKMGYPPYSIGLMLDEEENT